MNVRTERRGLGRGLGELFQRTDPQRIAAPANGQPEPTPMAPVPDGSYFADLPLDSISPNPRQPRTVFDEDAMNELVESIREIGMLQPVVVRPLGGSRFELVMGERRWRAAQQAGVETIPAIVRETADHELLRDALLENLHRADLNPLRTSKCSRTSAAPWRSSPVGSSAPDLRSPTRSGYSGCHQLCNGVLPLA